MENTEITSEQKPEQKPEQTPDNGIKYISDQQIQASAKATVEDNGQVKPDKTIESRIKTIVSVAILLLVIGFISSSENKIRQTPNPVVASTPIVQKPIDADFFASTTISSQLPPATKATKPVAAPADIITADSYLVANLQTGQVYLQKDPTAVRPIASISKLIAAIVAVKRLDPNAVVTVLPQSITGFDATNSPSTIIPGEQFTVHDILYDMLLVSSNDAVTTLADNYAVLAGDANPASRADFVSLMDSTAASLGMTSTSFADPSGLSPGNKSSANDLFKLAQYLYATQPGILAIATTPEYDVATTTAPDPAHNAHAFVNIDPFVYDPHYIGGKTGRTDEAGETMLSMFNLPVNGVTYPIAIIVLHSDQDARQVDSSILVSRVMTAIAKQ